MVKNSNDSGFKRLGFVKNLRDYLTILNNATGNIVDLHSLNTFIDNEIDSGNILFFGKNGDTVQDENHARFKLVNTGLKDKNSGQAIYGSFEKVSQTRWNGVFIGSLRFLQIGMKNRKDEYRMGLMFFETKEKANAFISNLHGMLLPGEKWSFQNSSQKQSVTIHEKTDYPILESYIKNIYAKLIKDHLDLSNPDNINKGKIIKSSYGRFMLFNSGLLNKYVEEICIIGELVTTKNKSIAYCKNPIIANGKRDTITTYKFKQEDVEDWPEIVSFFDDINQVVFNAKSERIDLDYESLEHCIDERVLLRWPGKYQDLYKKGDVKTISDALKNAINNALMIAKRNYKYVVPQYRPTTDTIQFLMPIYLDNEYDKSPDFALVLALDDATHYYFPETVLKLDDAYNNARLIAKPDDLWLNPDRITESEESDEIDEEGNDE